MIKKLVCDSSFFNFPIYDFQDSNVDNNAILNELSSVVHGLIQCRLDTREYRLMELLIHNNFKIEDHGVIFSKIPDGNLDLKLETAVESDEESLYNIVHGSFDKTRFKDSYFGVDSAEKIYKYWVTAAIKGIYDNCCIIKKNKRGLIVGFVTVKKVADYLRVGLIAVDKKYKRKNIGGDLMGLVEMYASYNGINKIMVTTQYDNTPAIKLYNTMKYNVSSEFYWLYLKV